MLGKSGRLLKVTFSWCRVKYLSGMNFRTVGTHDGTFHCDEVLGCYMLRCLNKDCEIVRSRNPEILEKCDVVIDVGAVYDPDRRRFDHHQKGFEHTMRSLNTDMPYDIKLSSAGLIYAHFGREVVRSIAGDVDDRALPYIYKEVYESLIQEVDGIDNGVPVCDGEAKYTINTGLSKRVARLNRKWNDPDGFDEGEAFRKAMETAGMELQEAVLNAWKVWWPARDAVSRALDARKDVHQCGEIIVIDKYLPFISHLLALEKINKISPTIKYVLYKDKRQWRIRAVPIKEDSFITRVPLLESWRGLRDQQLLEAGAPEGSHFVHSTGFIGGNATLDGAIQMSLKSLAANQ